jgi:glycine hydroxymethyltransferase
MAVREVLASAFQNIYAEGCPDEESRWITEEENLDYPGRLAHDRRSGDPRFYKSIEYAGAVEAMARRRAIGIGGGEEAEGDQKWPN